MKRIYVRLLLIPLIALLSVTPPQTHAQINVQPSGILYLVTTLDDHSDGACDTDCTLREAIDEANAHSGVDGIRFGVTGTINLGSALPVIFDSVNITGPGPQLLTVRRNTETNFRIFTVTATGTVGLSGMTIANGSATASTCTSSPFDAFNCAGGGIYNATGTLNIVNCTLSSNTGTNAGAIVNDGGTLNMSASSFVNNLGVFAGAIVNVGTNVSPAGPISHINVSDSTFFSNAATSGATGFGGAIVIGDHSEGTIRNSTFVGNGAIIGGAIAVFGKLTIFNSTFTRNIAQTGGAFYSNGPTDLTVSNSTIAGNSASLSGGGITGFNKPPTVISSIIATNAATSRPDLWSAVTSGGFNLIGVIDGSTGFTATTDQTGTLASPLNPKLDPDGLQDHGGPTQTIGLQGDSPAIDKGTSSSLLTDQRGTGFVRTFDNSSIANAAGGDGTDIGAYEVQNSLTVGVVANVVGILPVADFRIPGNKNSTLSRLKDIQQLILAGSTNDAVQGLKDLRRRMDGCGSLGADNDDWITNCTSQVHVRALVDKLIASPLP